MSIQSLLNTLEQKVQQLAQAYQDDSDKKINAKSLLNIIGACIKCGSEIELVCEGPDEEAALAHATELIESGLGE